MKQTSALDHQATIRPTSTQCQFDYINLQNSLPSIFSLDLSQFNQNRVDNFFFHVFSKCLISPQCQCNLTQLIESLRENRFLLSFVDTLSRRGRFFAVIFPPYAVLYLLVETHYQHLILCSVKYIFLTFFELFEKYETNFLPVLL